MHLSRLKDILTNKAVVGVTGPSARIFVRCHDCRRVVPAWQVMKVKPEGLTGCKCGCSYVKPSKLPEWQAAWWVLVRGMLIRKVLKRRSDWEPRIPQRPMVVARGA